MEMVCRAGTSHIVSNVVDANILACKTKETGTFNVACGRRIVLNDSSRYVK